MEERTKSKITRTNDQVNTNYYTNSDANPENDAKAITLARHVELAGSKHADPVDAQPNDRTSPSIIAQRYYVEQTARLDAEALLAGEIAARATVQRVADEAIEHAQTERTARLIAESRLAGEIAGRIARHRTMSESIKRRRSERAALQSAEAQLTERAARVAQLWSATDGRMEAQRAAFETAERQLSERTAQLDAAEDQITELSEQLEVSERQLAECNFQLELAQREALKFARAPSVENNADDTKAA